MNQFAAIGLYLLLSVSAALTQTEEPDLGDSRPTVLASVAPLPSTHQVELSCKRVNTYWGNRGLMPLEGRASPYDSTIIVIGSDRAKLCYGRPRIEGRP